MNDFPEIHLITNGSMAGDLQSQAVNIHRKQTYSVQFVWSGGTSPVGSVSLEHSNDATNWNQVTNSSLAVSGASGSHQIEVTDIAAKFMRAVYTRTSGDGTLNAYFAAKGYFG